MQMENANLHSHFPWRLLDRLFDVSVCEMENFHVEKSWKSYKKQKTLSAISEGIQAEIKHKSLQKNFCQRISLAQKLLTQIHPLQNFDVYQKPKHTKEMFCQRLSTTFRGTNEVKHLNVDVTLGVENVSFFP
jgi:hypothetical protein